MNFYWNLIPNYYFRFLWEWSTILGQWLKYYSLDLCCLSAMKFKRTFILINIEIADWYGDRRDINYMVGSLLLIYLFKFNFKFTRFTRFLQTESNTISANQLNDWRWNWFLHLCHHLKYTSILIAVQHNSPLNYL